MISLTKEKKNIVGYYLIGICMVIFALLAISALALKGDKYDPETFCPDRIDAHTVVLLDKTDFFSPTQKSFILDYINKEKDKIKTFEKFSFFTLTENTYTPEPVFSKCNPGTGKDANQLYQNPRKIQMKFDEFFSIPLKENINNILVNDTGSKTPLFENIRELPLREDFAKDVSNRTLIIISDLMNHTSEYSQYKGKIDYKSFSKMPYAYEVAANLNSVKIKIVYLLRDELRRFQGDGHLSFWKDYFKEMGAEIVDVKSVK